jgi:hypothetical protein
MFFNKKRFSLMFILLFYCYSSSYSNPDLEDIKEVSLPISTYLKTSLKLFSPSDSFFNCLDLAAITLSIESIIKDITHPPAQQGGRPVSSSSLVGLFSITLSMMNLIENYSSSIENQKKRRKLTAEQLVYQEQLANKIDNVSLPASAYLKATWGLISSPTMIVANFINVLALLTHSIAVGEMIYDFKRTLTIPKAIPFSALFFVGAVGQIIRNYNVTLRSYKRQKVRELEFIAKQM